MPKYRYRVLKGPVAEEVFTCLQVFYGQLGCEVVEVNVQPDHVHLLVKIPPKVSISEFMGTVKVAQQYGRPYWGNHLWADGYCVDTVGLDAEMIRKYVVFQERKEREQQS